MDRRIDVALAIGVVALGLFILVTAQFIGRSPVPDPIGPRGMPTGIGVGFVLGGFALAIRRLGRWNSDNTLVSPEGSEDDAGVPPGSARRAMGIWVSATAYAVLLPYLGFIIATPIMVGAMLRLLELNRPPMLGRVPSLLALPILFTVAAYLVFALVLGVRLPLGFPRDLFVLIMEAG